MSESLFVDHVGDALRIFRDCLRPRIEGWIQSASEEQIEALRDRELLQADDVLRTDSYHDPVFLLDLILNCDELKRDLFGRGAGLEQLTQLRHTRNRWAHFSDTTFNRQRSDVNGIAKLLTDAGHKDEAARVKSLVRRQRQAADVEAVNFRAGEVAAKELEVSRREDAMARDQADLRSAQDALAEQRSLIEREQEQLQQRRQKVERQQQELLDVPTADALLRRQQAVEADETVVADLRIQYQQAIERSKGRETDLQRREVELRAREAEASSKQAEIDELHATAADLSHRLSQPAERLERLEARSRRAASQAGPSDAATAAQSAPPKTRAHGDVTRAPGTSSAPENGRKRSSNPRRGAPSHIEARTCLRPGCGGVMEKRSGKFGDFMGCNNYPKCRYTEEVRAEGSDPPPMLGPCPDCESPLQRRRGRSGDFLGCSDYPRCRYTQSLETQPRDHDAVPFPEKDPFE